MKELTPETMAAYLAGIIDGEGSISFGCLDYRKGHSNVRITVNNTSPELILRLNLWWPDSRFSPKPKRTGYRQSWIWNVRAGSHVRFLKFILPYLCIKRSQAKLAILYYQRCSIQSGIIKKLTDAEIKKRSVFIRLMHKLNHPVKDTKCPTQLMKNR